jgi:hypothetical protein
MIEQKLSLDDILLRAPEVSEEFIQNLKNSYPKEEAKIEAPDLDPELIERLSKNAFYKPSVLQVQEEKINEIAEGYKREKPITDTINVIYMDKVADSKIKERIIKLYRKDRDAQIRANKKQHREFQKSLKQSQYKLIKQQEEILKNEQNN